jgi:hypothetical protein
MKKVKHEEIKRREPAHQDNHVDKSEPKLKRNPHFGKMFNPCV